MAVSERVKRIMIPDTPKQESMIAEAIDRWEEEKTKLEMPGTE